jgi:Uma2 family endonuclease
LLVQAPIAATADSEPEPDVALVPGPADPRALPQTAQLAVEVVVTQRAAAHRKAPIYARAGVDEYWIVDVPDETVVVHRNPVAGRYTAIVGRSGADTLEPPLGLPARTVSELFA